MEEQFDNLENSLQNAFNAFELPIENSDWVNIIDGIQLKPEYDEFENSIKESINDANPSAVENTDWTAISAKLGNNAASPLEKGFKNVFRGWTLPVNASDWRAILMMLPIGRSGLSRNSIILTSLSLLVIAGFGTLLISLSGDKKVKTHGLVNTKIQIFDNNSLLSPLPMMNETVTYSKEEPIPDLKLKSDDVPYFERQVNKTDLDNTKHEITNIKKEEVSSKPIFSKTNNGYLADSKNLTIVGLNKPKIKLESPKSGAIMIFGLGMQSQIINLINVSPTVDIKTYKPRLSKLPLIAVRKWEPFVAAGLGYTIGQYRGVKTEDENQFKTSGGKNQLVGMILNLGIKYNIGSGYSVSSGIKFDMALRGSGSRDTVKIRIATNYINYRGINGDLQYRKARAWKDSVLITSNNPQASYIDIPLMIGKDWTISKKYVISTKIGGSIGVLTGASGKMANPYLHDDHSYWKNEKGINASNDYVVNVKPFMNKTRSNLMVEAGISKSNSTGSSSIVLGINKSLQNQFKSTSGINYQPVQWTIQLQKIIKLYNQQ
jgi:hypothetical protein